MRSRADKILGYIAVISHALPIFPTSYHCGVLSQQNEKLHQYNSYFGGPFGHTLEGGQVYTVYVGMTVGMPAQALYKYKMRCLEARINVFSPPVR